MNQRTQLTKETDSEQFLCSYYLKEELVVFCRENSLSTSGSKQELTQRIAYYLSTGKSLVFSPRKASRSSNLSNISLSLNTIIEDNFICTEQHRAFFKSVIGDHFHFSVAFQKYLKSNAGTSYKEAVDYWHLLQQQSKQKVRKQIDSQFEYNTYIRDFFEANKGMSLKDAITCWNYKKLLVGEHTYSCDDLMVLER